MEQFKVGFIGLGKMGEGMAKNLLKAGFHITVYDVRKDPVDQLTQLGAAGADSPREVGAKSDLVISMVRNTQQTEEVFLGNEGIAKGMKKGSLIIMSTISPVFVRRLAVELKGTYGLWLLDAPVSGAPMAAEAGTLTVMVGGEKEIYQRCLPVLQAMGKNIFYCGGSGTGLVAKITNNLIYAATMVSLSEAITLGLKDGIDLNVLLGIYKVSSGGCWAVDHWDFVAQMRKDVHPESIMEVLYKDLRLAVDFAKSKGIPMPIATFCSQLDLYDRE